MNTVNAKAIVGDWLDKTNRTQADLAQELGMLPSTLSMILNGQRRMSLEDALRASQLSGLSIDIFHRLWTDRRPEEQQVA